MINLRKAVKTIAGVVMSLTLACAAVPVTMASATTITFLQGDVSGDGAVSIADATMLTRYLSGGVAVDSNQLTRMDVVQNKVIEKQDYNKIVGYCTGLATPQNVTADVLTTVNNESRAYRVYDCDNNNQYVGSYTLSASTSAASINSKIFETMDDYKDSENLNTVKITSDTGYSTGFIVDDNVVVTAAHCICSIKGQFFQNLRVEVYDADTTKIIDTYDADFVHIPQLYYNNIPSGPWVNYDYALIYVKNNNKNEDLSKHGIWSLGYMTDEFMTTGSNVIASGFTEEGESKPFSRYYSCGPIIPVPDNLPNDDPELRFNAGAQSYGGKSGGPVYYETTYNNNVVKSVVGITVGGGNNGDSNVWGTRITPTVAKFFLDNTNIERYANRYN